MKTKMLINILLLSFSAFIVGCGQHEDLKTLEAMDVNPSIEPTTSNIANDLQYELDRKSLDEFSIGESLRQYDAYGYPLVQKSLLLTDEKISRGHLYELCEDYGVTEKELLIFNNAKTMEELLIRKEVLFPIYWTEIEAEPDEDEKQETEDGLPPESKKEESPNSKTAHFEK